MTKLSRILFVFLFGYWRSTCSIKKLMECIWHCFKWLISFLSLQSAILLRHNCILLRNKSIRLLSRLSFAILSGVSFAILSGLTFAIYPFWLSFFQRIIFVTLAKINMCSLPGFYIRIVNWILIFFPRIKHALCLLKLISLEQLLLLLAFLVRFILKFSATHI